MLRGEGSRRKHVEGPAAWGNGAVRAVPGLYHGRPAVKQLDALRDDLKANEARQREEMREMRADMKALGEKMDRLVESLMTVRK